ADARGGNVSNGADRIEAEFQHARPIANTELVPASTFGEREPEKICLVPGSTQAVANVRDVLRSVNASRIRDHSERVAPERHGGQHRLAYASFECGFRGDGSTSRRDRESIEEFASVRALEMHAERLGDEPERQADNRPAKPTVG